MLTNATDARGQGSAAGQAEALCRQGFALHQQGRLDAARELYEQTLEREPHHFNALHLLGLVALQSQEAERAAQLIGQALRINPHSAAAHCNHGNALRALGRFEAAIQSYDQAIALKPDFTEAHYNRANALRALQRYEEAVAGYTQAIALKPDHAEAYNNRGLALCELKQLQAAIDSFDAALALKPEDAQIYYARGFPLAGLSQHEAALASFEKAIALLPDHAQAHTYRGTVLQQLKRVDEALCSYERALQINPHDAEACLHRGSALQELKRYEEALRCYERALQIRPDYAEAYHNCGTTLSALRRHAQALKCYERALKLKPDRPDTHNNRALALLELTQTQAALSAFDKAIALNPNHAEAHYNRGNLLCTLKCYEAAIDSFDRAIALKPDHAMAFNNRAICFSGLGRLEEALASLDQTFAIDPKSKYAAGMRLNARAQLCAWAGFETEVAHLIQSIECGDTASPPFALLTLSGSASVQRKAAEIWVRESCPPDPTASAILKRERHERIRIGYFSPDYRLHPVSILMAELFEVHDRERFEVTAFSYGADTQDEMRLRLKGAFERFIDVRDRSDRQIVELARSLQIDIAVDLAGLTMDGRPQIFAQRAAPVQVSYLGYAGTMGAPYMDYLIADRVLIPAGAQAHYREKILYMPESFMVNDSKRAIAEKRFSRAELMLPESGFVYCCFNNSYKIAPDTFSGWMRILRAVPDSVLWLPQSNATAQRNLRSEAGSRGVSAERLIFAPRLASMAEHLARLRVADLFLDTLPYNAHTTASDALWAGLPVLTCLGEAFAGRVAGSLLQALGLPELITQSPGEYEALAVQLGLNPERLAGIKGKLAANRLTQPLFDTPRFARHLEAAFAQIHARYQADLPPEHVYIEAQQSATPVPVETQDVCTVASHVD